MQIKEGIVDGAGLRRMLIVDDDPYILATSVLTAAMMYSTTSKVEASVVPT